MTHRTARLMPVLALLAAAAPAAHAQFAVIDIASVTQLISQLQTLEQQLATARSQLAQAQAEYQSMTGDRGMQALLGGTARNYLPADWSTLERVLQGSGAFPGLGAELRGALTSDAVLSDAQLAALPTSLSLQLQAQRRSGALLQALTHEALANSSARFAALQQLIDAIGGAADQKAILDLQARIGAEGGMLENEHTKLADLYQALEAERQANSQRVRELTVAGHGQFGARFQPQP